LGMVVNNFLPSPAKSIRHKYMAKKKELTDEQLRFILGDDWQWFNDEILTNCFCTCEPRELRTIVDYKIALNKFNDVELTGKCNHCGGPIGRYVETGESEEYLKRIKKLDFK